MNNGDMLAAIAAEGVGITCELDFIVDPLIAAGKLMPILKDYRAPSAGIFAVPSRRHLSAKVRVFVDYDSQKIVRPSLQRAAGLSPNLRSRPASQ